MSPVLKTTVYLGRDEYRRPTELAAATGVKPAALLREAVAEYNARHTVRRPPRSVGVGRSGRRDVSVRAEELLADFGRHR
jgi:hypothetical protein